MAQAGAYCTGTSHMGMSWYGSVSIGVDGTRNGWT